MNRLITRRPAVPTAESDGTLHPVLARIYRARNASGVDEADRSLERLLAPSGLKGIEPAVALLIETLRTDGRILVVADFDFMQINNQYVQGQREAFPPKRMLMGDSMRKSG